MVLFKFIIEYMLVVLILRVYFICTLLLLQQLILFLVRVMKI
jgi:hypothetical protein